MKYNIYNLRFFNNKINVRSIRFRIWTLLLLFTLVIMLLMWLLQILFINTYYEDMKIDNTKDAAAVISSAYKSGGLKAAIKEAKSASDGNDIFIVLTKNGERKYPAVDNSTYAYELSEIESSFISRKTNKNAAEGTIESSGTERSIYYYAEDLDATDEKTITPKDETDIQSEPQDSDTSVPQVQTGTILYVLSPLYPVSSTISIMQKQLGYVMFISLVLAILFAVVLSRRISKPITDITSSANKLAEGQYGVSFPADSNYSEIHDLAETLNKMSGELERSAMMQKDLMANVSHDLRTPLTMIKSYAEMIRDLSGDNPEKRNAHLEVIIEESDRLNTLVNDMLALSAMQSGTMGMDIQPFNIYNAVQSILAPYRVLEEKEGYTVNFNCRKDLFVEGDEERIKQVISNLLSNAVKYCGTDKTVFINIRKWDKIVHFEVVDHGVGIKPEELSLIWDRHYKTSSNHVRPTRGSGLGLSIVREILEMHGAKFGAESKVGKGTTVWFELAAASAPVIDHMT